MAGDKGSFEVGAATVLTGVDGPGPKCSGEYLFGDLERIDLANHRAGTEVSGVPDS